MQSEETYPALIREKGNFGRVGRESLILRGRRPHDLGNRNRRLPDYWKMEERDYLLAIVKRYRVATKKEKRKILDEFCKVCEYNRKYANLLIRRGDPASESRQR